MIVLDGLVQLWLSHFLENLLVMGCKCPYELSVGVQKHGVLLVVVIEKGAFEMPSFEEVEP